MIKSFVMTGSEVDVGDIIKGDESVTAPYINADGYSDQPNKTEILFKADPDNASKIFLSEISGPSSTQLFPLAPGEVVTINWTPSVRESNQFYASGSASDLLIIWAR